MMKKPSKIANKYDPVSSPKLKSNKLTSAVSNDTQNLKNEND